MGERRGAPAVLAAAVLWGTVGAAQELGAPTAAPAGVAAVRSLVGGGVLLLLFVGWRRWSELARMVRDAPVRTAVVVVAMAGFQLGYLGGIRLTGVAIGTLLAIGSAPAFAGLLAALDGARPGVAWLVTTIVTVLGAAVLLLGDGARAPDPGGVALGLVAGLSYGAYTVGSKALLVRGHRGGLVVGVSLTGAGIVLAPALVLTDTAWVATLSGGLTAAWIALAATVVAYAAFARGLLTVDAPTATTLTLAEPLTASLLALGLVGERLAGGSAVGAVLLGTGLLVAAARPASRLGPGSRRPGRTEGRR